MLFVLYQRQKEPFKPVISNKFRIQGLSWFGDVLVQ